MASVKQHSESLIMKQLCSLPQLLTTFAIIPCSLRFRDADPAEGDAEKAEGALLNNETPANGLPAAFR